MATDRLTQAVRHQLGLGRLLPLGGAADGAWVTEEAAVGVLRAAAVTAVPGVRLSEVRLDLSDPGTAAEPAVPRPPSALSPGPLTLTADLATTADAPLPTVAETLRGTLLAAAERELGLTLRTVDLRITDLLDEPEPGPDSPEDDAPAPGDAAQDAAATRKDDADPASRVAAAVLAVPGVTQLAPVLGSPLTVATGGTAARAVTLSDENRHALLQVAVAPGHRALDVARAAREAATGAAGSGTPATAAVLVTAAGRR